MLNQFFEAALSKRIQSNFVVNFRHFSTFILPYMFQLVNPVAALSKVWVCGHSLTGIAGSNPAGGMDVYLL